MRQPFISDRLISGDDQFIAGGLVCSRLFGKVVEGRQGGPPSGQLDPAPTLDGQWGNHRCLSVAVAQTRGRKATRAALPRPFAAVPLSPSPGPWPRHSPPHPEQFLSAWLSHKPKSLCPPRAVKGECSKLLSGRIAANHNRLPATVPPARQVFPRTNVRVSNAQSIDCVNR